MYGPTETTVWSSTHDVGLDAGAVSIGRPIANTQIYVLDAALNPVPVGVIGELYIAGDGVARGYFERPELTRERFLDDPFASGRMYRTGDLARYRRDGTLDFLGRADHQIKLRGYRIELGEIESAMRRHAPVAEAAAIVREESRDDKRLVAYLVARPGQTIVLESLRADLRAALPDYMMPAAFVILSSFPLTPNGKLDRNALAHVTAPAPAAPVAALPQNDNVEAVIAAIWCEALKLPKVSRRDNFFDLGGHSLLMVHVLNRLREAIPKPISMTDMFRFPTVEALAGYLRASDEPAGATDNQLDRAQKRAALRRDRIRPDNRPAPVRSA
jgi:hypothetical protein